jgi:hypothetical protein
VAKIRSKTAGQLPLYALCGLLVNFLRLPIHPRYVHGLPRP